MAEHQIRLPRVKEPFVPQHNTTLDLEHNGVPWQCFLAKENIRESS
jgi:hypothetical protein